MRQEATVEKVCVYRTVASCWLLHAVVSPYGLVKRKIPYSVPIVTQSNAVMLGMEANTAEHFEVIPRQVDGLCKEMAYLVAMYGWKLDSLRDHIEVYWEGNPSVEQLCERTAYFAVRLYEVER